MKRAALYLRVSTIDQTTANQERELREIAGRMGCDVVKVYKTTASAAPKVVISAPPSMRCAVLRRAGNSTWLWLGRSIGLAGACKTSWASYPSCTLCG
jgi:hypothetical protein